MAEYIASPLRTRPAWRDWLSFLAQISLVAGVELGDEFARGTIAQHDSYTGLANALRVVDFEDAHDLWIEPAVQTFFRHTHHLLDLTISWAQIIPIVNFIYIAAHIGITLLFALWVFFFRRGIFAFVRNVFFITNALALVVYELYPMAPPRLTTGLRFDGHPFRFVDTLYQVLGSDGKVVGTRIGYNEFAAMPSVHVAWALIVGMTVAWAARPLLIRLLALCYPLLMVLTVVVTGNHYIADALGAATIVAMAIPLSLLSLWLPRRHESPSALVRRLQQQRHGPSNRERRADEQKPDGSQHSGLPAARQGYRSPIHAH